DLARAVGLEYGRLEDPFDQLPLEIVQFFRADHDRFRRKRDLPALVERPSEDVERIRVGHDDIGAPTIEPLQEFGHAFLAELEGADDRVPVEPIVKVVLPALPAGSLAERDAPQIELLRAGLRAGPAVAPMPDRRAAIVAVGVEIEVQGHAARAARR